MAGSRGNGEGGERDILTSLVAQSRSNRCQSLLMDSVKGNSVIRFLSRARPIFRVPLSPLIDRYGRRIRPFLKLSFARETEEGSRDKSVLMEEMLEEIYRDGNFCTNPRGYKKF